MIKNNGQELVSNFKFYDRIACYFFQMSPYIARNATVDNDIITFGIIANSKNYNTTLNISTVSEEMRTDEYAKCCAEQMLKSLDRSIERDLMRQALKLKSNIDIKHAGLLLSSLSELSPYEIARVDIREDRYIDLDFRHEFKKYSCRFFLPDVTHGNAKQTAEGIIAEVAELIEPLKRRIN